jgi:SAM-dependent methyltransferase
MASQIAVDFGRAAGDYARHRQGFPPEFFARLGALGLIVAGKRALDVGAGTGALARAFVADGADVTALDPSAPMLREARALEPRLRCAVGRAEALPFVAGAFDLVSAATCWHWFDRAAAAREARRVLAPGGALLIAHHDFHRLPDGVVAATFEAIRQFEAGPPPAHQPTFVYPYWLDDLSAAGFLSFEAFAFSDVAEYSHEGWIGRMRANGRVTAFDAHTLRSWEAALRRRLMERFPAEPLAVPHRVFALLAR